MSALPVLLPVPDCLIYVAIPDGAYYQIGCDNAPNEAQVMVVGVMHFTPGEYIDALKDVTSGDYVHVSSEFMGTDYLAPELKKRVLNRGFVSLIARKAT